MYEGLLMYEKTKCLDKCNKLEKGKERCKKECSIIEAKLMSKGIEKNLRQCKSKECTNMMYKLLHKWKQKEVSRQY